MAARDDGRRAPWWKRALAAFGPARRVETLVQNIAFTDDAAELLRRAGELGRGSVEWRHLLLAAAESIELASFWSSSGLAPAKLADAAGRAPDGALLRAQLTARLQVYGSGRTEARAGDLLLAIGRVDKDAGARLDKAGLTRLRLSTFLAHGVVEHPPLAPPRGEELDVLIHNDDYTTQEFVVELLESVFALPRNDAIARMREVHEAGAGVVASLPRSDAIERATKAAALAKNAGFPLLVTVENLTA